MNDIPFFSVIIPAYNAENFLQNCIESVDYQSFDQYELIVVNDGSTDETANILAACGNSVRIINQENAGLSAARNTGIKNARGKWVAFLDADDSWQPEKLKKQFEALQESPSAGFCSTHAVLVDESGAKIGEWACPSIEGTLLKSIFRRNAAIPGSGSGVVVRRDLFDQVGMFDTTLTSLEDIDMWMRLASVTDYVCVTEPLTVIQRSTNSMSSNYTKMRDNALTVMKKNRVLLSRKDQGGFWRACMAGVLADYAKWAYRDGYIRRAYRDLFSALRTAPFVHGRLVLGLFADMLRNREI